MLPVAPWHGLPPHTRHTHDRAHTRLHRPQVTLFRVHRHTAPPASLPWRGVFKQGHNAIWLNLYRWARAGRQQSIRCSMDS